MTDPGQYVPRTPTVEQLDAAIARLNGYPTAIQRPDFVDGCMASLSALGHSLRVFGHVNAARLPESHLAALVWLTQNIGDNFELYRAVRDALFPLDPRIPGAGPSS